jgi:hypothetical protein
MSRSAIYRGSAIRGAVFAGVLTLFAILAAFISPKRIAAQKRNPHLICSVAGLSRLRCVRIGRQWCCYALVWV